jgi:hypothetical protein
VAVQHFQLPNKLAGSQLAHLLMNHNHCLASQHLKGELNTITNLLSFAGHSWEKPHPMN